MRVAGSDPSTVQIGSYSAAFDKSGSWTYAASMSGKFEGMQLKGQGTWAIKDGTLSWTAGANSGTSKIIFTGTDQVALDPDPVITTPGGKQAVRTDYVRVMDGKYRAAVGEAISRTRLRRWIRREAMAECRG
jgi:hypothetical protein